MTEYLDKNTAVDEGYLFEWYIFSLPEYNDEKLNEPRWTEEHIEELTNDFIVIPKDTPAADVAPVVHGHWVKDKECDRFSGTCIVNKKCICSECDWGVFCEDGVVDWGFCPNCGAKMERDENA